jgi:uncharacterized membrane protein
MDFEWVPRIVLFVVLVSAGVLVIWVAQVAASGRLRRNHNIGIRTRATMASDEAWLAAHIRAERPTVFCGLVSVAGGVFALLPLPMPTVLIAILAAAVAVLVLVLHSLRVGMQAARALSDD